MKFCPQCGHASITPSPKFFTCKECGYTLFINVAAAVAAIIEHDDLILATIRAKNPSAGKLDLPGGFVDHGETAEQALRRELEEELTLKEFTPFYFGTYTNIYPYKSVKIHTLDLVFTVKLRSMPDINPLDDVASIKWIKKSDLKIQAFAFSSIREALSDYTKID